MGRRVQLKWPASKRTMRTLKVRVTVKRQAVSSGAGAFKACVHLGALARTMPCGFGENPRKAIALAMERAAHTLSQRRGAFGRKGR